MKKLALLCVVLFPAIVYSQCLSGIYTIGGASPDYTTVTAAVSALTTNGVCGPVVFNIRNGTYTEQINIPSVTGSSSANTITFQSESGDSSLVTLQYTPVSGNNYVLRINGTDHISFYKITINNLAIATSAFHGTVVITNDADSVFFDNCRFTATVNLNAPGVNGFYSMVYSDQANCDYLRFTHNLFQGNNFGIFITHSISVVGPIVPVISYNEFTGQYNKPIFVGLSAGGIIKKNKITCSPPYSPWLNVCIQAYTGTTDTLKIIENDITTTGTGIYSDANNGPTVIANNSIIVLSGTDGLGIQMGPNSGRVFIINNSVLSRGGIGPYVSPAIFFTNNPSNVTVKNNVFIQTARGPVYRTDVTPIPGYVSEHNVLYTNGDTFALTFSSTSYVHNLYEWSTLTGQEWNSVVGPASFVSNTDLHVTADFSQNVPTQTESNITTDKDGLPRDPANPYPGAYEFNNVLNTIDAGTVHVNTVIPHPCSSGLTHVIIRNFGTQALTSVTINFSVNAVIQTPVIWTGNLSYFDTVSVLINVTAFSPGRPNNVLFWTSNPNSSADPCILNDATQVLVNAAFTGTFTIGGALPDFATITSAVTALSANGVCGPTEFRIRNGTYTEWMRIGPIQGSSPSNTIRFTSDNGDSSLVRVLNNTSFSSTDYVFKLDSASYITFDHIWMDHPTGRVIYILGGAHDIDFHNNILSGPPGSSFSPILADEITTVEYNINVHHNRFTGASVAIMLRYNNAAYQQGITIANNVIQNPQFNGIIIDKSRNLLVHDNVVNGSQTGPAMVTGISIDGASDSIRVYNNRIYGAFNTGMLLNNLITGAGYSYKVYNNFVQATVGTAIGAGIRVNASNYLELANNNVHLRGAYSSVILPGALRITGGANITLKNNNLRADQSAPAMYLNVIPAGFVSDHNNFSSGTGNLVQYGSYIYPTLASWQATTFDINSISTNPLYVSSTNMHVQNVIIRDAGAAISYISQDVDGDTRSNPPDIGADENNTAYVDAGVVGLDSSYVICNGVNPVQVWLRNGGTVNLTQVTINWTVNSAAQPIVNWTGFLAPGDSANVILGTYTFAPATAYIFGVHCAQPNAQPDDLAFNDTCTRTLSGIGMSGTYTVGGVGPNFSTPVLALNALMNRGVCGPVTFLIRNGTYVSPLNFGTITGASSTNRIRFQSQNGDSALVILACNTTAALNYVVSFNNTSYVTFSKVSIQALNMPYGCDIAFSGVCSNDSISHCRILSGTVASGTVTANQIVSNDNWIKRNIVVDQNYFYRGNQPFYWVNIGNGDSNIVMKKNNFVGHYGTGIAVTNAKDVVLIGNSFTQNWNNSLYTAVSLTNITNVCEISGNNIAGIDGSGMSLTNCGQASGPEVRVYNNFISCDQNGVIISGSDSVGFYFNSVLTSSTLVALKIDSTNGISILNNILACNGGTTLHLDTLWGNSGTDHNCNWGGSWRLGVNSYVTITSWRIATALDSHSVFANPSFTSAANLHFVIPSPVSNIGITIPGILSDIDGDPRSTAPDIGADERVEVQLDAGVLSALPIFQSCAYNTPVGITVTIKNYGFVTLTSAQINWEVDHVPQPPINWTGNLPMNGTTQVVLTSAIIFPNSTPFIQVWTDLPNGSPDTVNTNDTLVVTPNFPMMFGTYTIGGVNPDFPDFTTAVGALVSGGMCTPVIFRVRNGVYNEQIVIPAIPGNSITNTIRFESEMGDSSQVTLQYAPTTSSANYTLFVNGADYLTFHQIGISTVGTSFGSLIHIDGNSHHVTFSNNNIVGAFSANANFKCIEIASTGTSDSIYFHHNRIHQGSYALVVNSMSGYNHLFIHDNIFTNQYKGIELFGQQDLVFNDNVMITSVIYSAIYQLRLMSCSGSIAITGNVFEIDSAGTIVWQFESQYNNLGPNDSILIANNFFSIHHATVPWSSHCVWGENSGQINFVHNNLNQTGAMSADMSLHLRADTLIIQNCNFVNMTGGAMLDVDPYLSTIDYNNYYTNGNALAYLGNDTMHTLAQWQSHNVNLNSLNVDPLYVAQSDLHIQQSLLNAEGNIAQAMIVDIDEEMRGTPPDIGADEISSMLVITANFNSFSSVCEMAPVQFVNSSSGATSYQWHVNSIPAGTTTDLMYTFNSAGSYTVTLIAINGIQSDTISQTVSVLSLPVITITGGGALCAGDSLLLTASGGGTYSWTPTASLSGPASANTYAFPSANTSYTVTVTGSNGCSDTAQVLVTVNPLPSGITASGGGIICAGDSLLLTASGGGTYSWTPTTSLSAPTSANTYAFPSATTIYTVTVTGNNGCSDTAQTTVVVNPLPAQPVISQNGDTLFSSTASSYQWNYTGNPIPGATLNYYLPTQNGNYSVTVTDTNGCSITSGNYTFIGLYVTESVSDQMLIFPVPSVDGQLHLQSDSLAGGTYSILCLSVSGQLIEHRQVEHPGGTFSTVFRLPDAQGIYFIKLEREGELLFIRPIERL